MSFKPTSVPTKRLSASITSTQTTFKLDDIIGWNGVALTAADFGTQGYGVFRNGRRDLIEIFEFDPATIASSSITIVRRGLNFDGDTTTEISGNKLEWTAGDTFVDLGTDTPQMWKYLYDLILAGGGGGGSGDVVGPASSVSDRIALFDGITGKLLKDSGVLMSSLVQKPTSTNLGNLGATETVNFAGTTYQYGVLDSDVTITHSNEADGLSITLFLTYDGSAQRSITWSDVDEWANGQPPTEPTSTIRELIVTLLRIGSVTYGFHNTGNANDVLTDHGSLSGLGDDDHTQYSIISSGVVAPVSTPPRVGAIYIDTVLDDVYMSTGTASSADWLLISGGGVSDHGALSGLGDDDHSQYAIISSGAGSPSTTPPRIGAVYIDTTNDRAFFGFGTVDYADWRYVDTTINPYTPPAPATRITEDSVTRITEDGITRIEQ